MLTNMIKGNAVVSQLVSTNADNNEFLPIIIYRHIYRVGLWSPSLMWVQAVAHILTILFILSCISQSIHLVNSLNDLVASIECFSVLSFCVMGLLKLTALKFYMKQLKTIMKLSEKIDERKKVDINILTEDERQSEKEEGSHQDVEMLSKELNLMASAIPKLYITTTVVFIIAPFLEYAMFTLSGKKAKLPHVLPMWSPFDNSFLGYSAVVLTELVSALYCINIHIAFDVVCICSMIYISSQFSFLQLKVNKVGGRGKKCLHSERRDQITRERIRACHKHHQVLIKICKNLDVLLRPVMGLCFTIATLTLCATAVQFSANSSRVQFLTMMQYLGANLTQLFLFCRYGDIVYQKSNLGMLHVAWWEMAPRVRQELILLGYGLNKAQVLRAGWFYQINLRSFLSIVQTAYSFYALLNKRIIN